MARCGDEMIDPDVTGLIEDISAIFQLAPELNADNLSQLKTKEINEQLSGYAEQLYEQKEKEAGAENMRLLERLVMLHTIDGLWKEHLTAMDQLRQSSNLQAIRQIDPLVAYKKEAGAYFDSLLASIQHDLVHSIYHASIEKREALSPKRPQNIPLPAGGKPGRNDPCICGSGKKYKHCCGK
jgi:preprotein translocase subunit SecA